MKKGVIVSGLTATTMALTMGIALMSFSAAPCACESPGMLLLASAGLPTSVPYDLSPHPKVLEAGMDANLRGMVIRAGTDPYYFSGCIQENSQRVTCRLITAESTLLQRGYNIRFDTDHSGVFVKSHVSRFTIWR